MPRPARRSIAFSDLTEGKRTQEKILLCNRHLMIRPHGRRSERLLDLGNDAGIDQAASSIDVTSGGRTAIDIDPVDWRGGKDAFKLGLGGLRKRALPVNTARASPAGNEFFHPRQEKGFAEMAEGRLRLKVERPIDRSRPDCIRQE
jgi:hypothetical protein